jgi:hypothetical protein
LEGRWQNLYYGLVMMWLPYHSRSGNARITLS